MIALGMAAAGRIVVRQLVHQHQARAALQDGVQIHLRQHPALVGHALLGNGFDALGQKVGFDPAMGFHHADHGIHAVQLAAARLHQHLIGLADAGRRAQKNLQPATPRLPRFFQQGVRRRAARRCRSSGREIMPFARALHAWTLCVQRKVKLQDIDVRLAHQAEKPRLRHGLAPGP